LISEARFDDRSLSTMKFAAAHTPPKFSGWLILETMSGSMAEGTACDSIAGQMVAAGTAGASTAAAAAFPLLAISIE
jgi:hypothetical protein